MKIVVERSKSKVLVLVLKAKQALSGELAWLHRLLQELDLHRLVCFMRTREADGTGSTSICRYLLEAGQL